MKVLLVVFLFINLGVLMIIAFAISHIHDHLVWLEDHLESKNFWKGDE